MEIIDVRLDFFKGDFIGKTYIFEDDTSISLDKNFSVVDSDGMATCPKSKITTLEKFINKSICY